MGRRFALLGYPLSHSISPAIHRAAFRALGMPHDYVAIEVPSVEALDAAFAELRAGSLSGANVTVPHKRAAFERADEIDTTATETDVANVLVRSSDGRIWAHNTDAPALEAELAELLPAGGPRNRVAIVGAGGAACAAIVACRKLGFREIAVTSRSFADPAELAEGERARRMRTLGASALAWPGEGGHRKFEVFAASADLVVQATSAGLGGKHPEAGEAVAAVVPWHALPSHAIVYDVIYGFRMTPFLRSAEERGLRARGGLGMLLRQAASSFELWTGRGAPLDAMQRAADGAMASSRELR